MRFQEKYPARVTRGDDGVYRWSYTVDLSTDHTVRDLVYKIVAIICAAVCGLMLVFMAMQRDFSLAWIPPVCCGVVGLITLGSYRLFRAMVHDRYVLGYEMDSGSVTLVQKPAVRRGMETMALLAGVAGIAAGRPAEGLARSAGMAGAAQPARFRLKDVKKITRHPERNMINVNTRITTNQIWVPGEDYEMVDAFLREHTAAAPW